MKPRCSTFYLLVILLPLVSKVAVGYNNGLARTPQMGWNTWNNFGCDIDEELIIESAKFVAERLKFYGYECAHCSSYKYRAWTGTLTDLSVCRYCHGRLSGSLPTASPYGDLTVFCRLARCLQRPRYWCSSPGPRKIPQRDQGNFRQGA